MTANRRGPVETEGPQDDARPLLRVVAGRPAADELAALVTVVLARSRAHADEPGPSPSAWTDRANALRRPLPVGTGLWVRSGWVPGTRTRAGW